MPQLSLFTTTLTRGRLFLTIMVTVIALTVVVIANND